MSLEVQHASRFNNTGLPRAFFEGYEHQPSEPHIRREATAWSPGTVSDVIRHRETRTSSRTARGVRR